MTDTLPVITLLTDFGEAGSYVGAMKGVILTITPNARLVDISHEVDPQDIQQASSILLSVYPYFPPHTVHLIVVDPGVGTVRRPIALDTPRGRFVAPDNGVLTHVLLQEPEWQAVALDNSEYWRPTLSHTFHGRDIFSPAAAHLAGGLPLAQLGSAVDDLVKFKLPEVLVTSRSIRGRVLRIDHFGNIITDIAQLQWVDGNTIEFQPLLDGAQQEPLRFDAADTRISFSWHSVEGVHHTYGDVSPGRPLALIGSGGALEIAVNQGSARDRLGVKVGDVVTLVMGR